MTGFSLQMSAQICTKYKLHSQSNLRFDWVSSDWAKADFSKYKPSFASSCSLAKRASHLGADDLEGKVKSQVSQACLGKWLVAGAPGGGLEGSVDPHPVCVLSLKVSAWQNAQSPDSMLVFLFHLLLPCHLFLTLRKKKDLSLPYLESQQGISSPMLWSPLSCLKSDWKPTSFCLCEIHLLPFTELEIKTQ